MDEQATFGPIAANLGFQLHWADVEAMRLLAVRFAALAITPTRATATIYIARHEGCDQAALGRALGINRASTMKAVDELAALGLVERRAGRNRRSNALHPTAAGTALCRDIERVMAEHDADYFGRLSASDRATLTGLLKKLRARSPREIATIESLSA